MVLIIVGFKVGFFVKGFAVTFLVGFAVGFFEVGFLVVGLKVVGFLVVGLKVVGLATDGRVVGATDGLEVGAGVKHVATEQKGPSVEVGVALKVHPESTKISVFAMDRILSFHGHKFWLNADALPNMNSMSLTEPTFQPEMSWLNVVAQ